MQEMSVNTDKEGDLRSERGMRSDCRKGNRCGYRISVCCALAVFINVRRTQSPIPRKPLDMGNTPILISGRFDEHIEI